MNMMAPPGTYETETPLCYVSRMNDENIERSLDGFEAAAEALAELLAGARRQIDWYSPVVAPNLYGDERVDAALRRAVLEQPRLRVRLLLPPVNGWRQHCPRLTELIERLSALELRVPGRRGDGDASGEDRPEYGWGFVIADRRALLVLIDPQRGLGRYHPDGDGARGRSLQELFDTLWENARPDIELRKLGI
jgi:hypothetical protein